jgi:hypothetical protein
MTSASRVDGAEDTGKKKTSAGLAQAVDSWPAGLGDNRILLRQARHRTLFFFGNSWARTQLRVRSMPQSPWRIAGRGGGGGWCCPHRRFKAAKRGTNISPWLGKNKANLGGGGHQLRKSDKGSKILGLLSFCFYRSRRSLKNSLHFFLMRSTHHEAGHRWTGPGTAHAACVSKGVGGTHRSHAAALPSIVKPPIYSDHESSIGRTSWPPLI